MKMSRDASVEIEIEMAPCRGPSVLLQQLLQKRAEPKEDKAARQAGQGPGL